jgi:hypothetical protein
VTRLVGIGLFLPVPLVLALLTRAPLGELPSLGLAVVLIATHRLYARPFALSRVHYRCLWCAGTSADGPSLALVEPLGETSWRTCGVAHHERLRRVLGFEQTHAQWLRACILGSLVVLLAVMVLVGLAVLGPGQLDDAVALFRCAVPAAVLPLSLLGPRASPAAEPIRVPFPVHIQALVGTWAVLWLFRIVGVWWLVLAAQHAAARLLP